MSDTPNLLELTTDIVSAFVSRQDVKAKDLPKIIAEVHEALRMAADHAEQAESLKLVPAVPIENSVTDDLIVCLEDGKSFKSLKRHLRSRYDLTPEAYREKWGLPHDYPMVAPNYAKERSKLAKQMGLGRSES